jgi:hypothetical protein
LLSKKKKWIIKKNTYIYIRWINLKISSQQNKVSFIISVVSVIKNFRSWNLVFRKIILGFIIDRIFDWKIRVISSGSINRLIRINEKLTLIYWLLSILQTNFSLKQFINKEFQFTFQSIRTSFLLLILNLKCHCNFP